MAHSGADAALNTNKLTEKRASVAKLAKYGYRGV